LLTRYAGPSHCVAGRPPCAAVAAPQDDERQPKSQRDVREGCGMPEGIRTVQNRRRRRLEPRKRSPPGEQISNECFAGRDELVREQIPRPRLEAAVSNELTELGESFRPDAGVVIHEDGLSIQQEAR